MRKLSGRTWLSIITFVIILLVLFFSRNELAQAWQVMQTINIWALLAMLIPLQFVSYFAMGETLFTYLRSIGQGKNVSPLKFARLSLEMNFVNHMLPSAGVSGASYMGWRLKHIGVSLSKSTSAQLVRVVAVAGGYAIVLAAAVLFMLFDGSLNRWISLFAVVLVAATFILVAGMIYLLERAEKLSTLARGLVKIANTAVRLATFGRQKKKFPSVKPLADFLTDIQDDYRKIRTKKQLLVKPLIWGVVFTLAEVGMFYATFLALGHPINPAPIAIAFGLAGVAGIFMVTPGGAGLYEVVMISFLTVAGVNPGVGIAAIVLVRVLLMVGTIATGYYFYQQAIIKHGKHPDAAL